MNPAYHQHETGVTLHLRVTPNAGVDRIEQYETRDNDAQVLRLRVKAVPDKGKANAAVIALLAKFLHIPKSAIIVTSGETARLKTVSITGNGKSLAECLGTIPTK